MPVDQAPRRQGLILAVVLIFLSVIVVLGGALVRSTVLARQKSKAQLHRDQALWILESASQHALHRLRQDAEYTGEAWRTPDDAFAFGERGAAQIEVRQQSEEPRRSLHITASFPNTSSRRVTLRRIIPLPPETSEQNPPATD